jgi:hypothetical protein
MIRLRHLRRRSHGCIRTRLGRTRGFQIQLLVFIAKWYMDEK